MRNGVHVQRWAIPKRECPMNFRLNTGFTVLAYTVVACYFTYTTLLRLWFLPEANAEELRSTAWTREINTHNVSTAPSRSVSSAMGGKSQFTVSAPLTFFSGARLETHRRAESKDGQLVIVERQLGPTSCEVYSIGAKMPPRASGAARCNRTAHRIRSLQFFTAQLCSESSAERSRCLQTHLSSDADY